MRKPYKPLCRQPARPQGGASVQQGLSAAFECFALAGIAADKRYSLGVTLTLSEVIMRSFRSHQALLLTVLVAVGANFFLPLRAQAQQQTVSVLIVRHAEADGSQPTIPLSLIGRQRAELLAPTLKGMTFTHLLATHTTRTRQMLEAIAAAQNLQVIQLPTPGSILDGQPVTDQTSRRAPIEPIAAAVLKLPPGSVALVALNSENIYAILNRLGVPVAEPGKSCATGSMCVPCLDNRCFPAEFDRIWHLVLEPGRASPLAFLEFRYGVGWRAQER